MAQKLVPILAGLYMPHVATRRAGLWGSLGGLGVAVSYYVLVHMFGSFDVDWATQILRVRVGDVTLELWQEYALLVALPTSAAAFAAGALRDRTRR